MFRHRGTVVMEDDKEVDASAGSIPLVYTRRPH